MSEKTTILCTDIDDTILGDDAALSRFQDYITEQRDQDDFMLVYATGRPHVGCEDSVYDLVFNQVIPVPDAVIACVGTDIYAEPMESPSTPMDNFRSYISTGFNRDFLQMKLDRRDDLELQPETHQSARKLSYMVTTDMMFGEFCKSLAEDVEFYPCLTVYSKQKYLDIVPANAGKCHALGYLVNFWYFRRRIQRYRVITAGDSENDWDMIKGFTSILVGNAESHLRRYASIHYPKTVYCAQNFYAAGVIEGMEHWKGTTL
jgi:sucrose-6F-phosphate phosphohydrolase